MLLRADVSRLLLSLALLLLAAAPAHAQAVAAVRGITVGPIESSQQPGRGYGTEYTAALLDELVRLGANAISITPFGRIWSLQSTQILLDFEAPYAANRAAVGRLVAQAKARGLDVLIIPHLWVETPGWRGEIDPGSPERWAEYQRSYRDFVLSWAAAAEEFGADAFSIGVECKSWSGRFGSYWLQLIADVRASFRGKLGYSANWDEAENVLFWDALDFVGINAFYPLAAKGGSDYAAYASGAERALAQAGELGALVDKPVLFLEIGYTTRPDAAVEPWLWPDEMSGVRVDEWEQARALAALIGAAVSKPWFRGFFVWRYYANLDDVSQEAAWGFSPHAKLAERVLGNVFLTPWAADTDPALVWLEPRAPLRSWLSRKR
ncbi:MAG TPA: hypothetical protein VJR89_24245 [Polyangiales bacterium]|nr:hypothetical protein [Polyangiales bacterium]